MFASRHHPDGGASAHCDNSAIEAAITRYQTSRDLESLSQVVEMTQRRADTLIRFYRTTRYRSHDELISDVNFKLIRAVSKFDPHKGSAFTFVSQVIANTLFTSVTAARRDLARHRRLTKVDLNHLVTNGEVENQHGVEDMSNRIKSGVKTTLTDETELATQRWYVESFIDDRFESCRCACANAAMAVYRVSYDRSREIFDLTMLEVRRVLLDDLPPRQPIIAHRLHGTRLAWITRYAPLLSQDEFTKFVVLVKGLSPFLLLLVNPQSRSRRQDRNPAITRQNLLWIINGHPDAVPLFA
jgi:hypothetical protein